MSYINLSIIILWFAATFTAFSGNAWRPGGSPLLSRITFRGWISLICLAGSLSIGIYKEDLQRQMSQREEDQRVTLVSTIREQQQQIQQQTEKMGSLQSLLIESNRGLHRSISLMRNSANEIKEEQLNPIEAAFKRAVKTPRESDDAIVSLSGKNVVLIPSTHHASMFLYWGDLFQFKVIAGDNVSIAELSTLKLRVGEHTYPLHDGLTTGVYEETLRIDGTLPNPMRAVIINPLGLSNVDLIISIRTTAESRGQSEFREMMLTNPFAIKAASIYKITTANILNMRARPDSNSEILCNYSGRLIEEST